jgi:hypothetical protein
MSTLPTIPIGSFQPRYIQPSELATFGLPSQIQYPTILNMVDEASTMIDESCGRTDTDGNGSLVYTTYCERLLLPVGRNLVRLTFRPMVAVSLSTLLNLAASGANNVNNDDVNCFYTGALPNTLTVGTSTTVSPLLSASGRYGYTRRGQQAIYPDMNYGSSILQVAAFFGGPPQFTPIDVTMCDFDPRSGELWIPAGLYLSQYSEIFVSYNSGFDPTNMPRQIKHACASLIKNFLSRGGGATSVTDLSMGYHGIHATFTPDLIDPNIDRILQSFRTVRAD